MKPKNFDQLVEFAEITDRRIDDLLNVMELQKSRMDEIFHRVAKAIREELTKIEHVLEDMSNRIYALELQAGGLTE